MGGGGPGCWAGLEAGQAAPAPSSPAGSSAPPPGLPACLLALFTHVCLAGNILAERGGTTLPGPSAPGAHFGAGGAPQLVPGAPRGWTQLSSARRVSLPVPGVACKGTWWVFPFNLQVTIRSVKQTVPLGLLKLSFTKSRTGYCSFRPVGRQIKFCMPFDPAVFVLELYPRSYWDKRQVCRTVSAVLFITIKNRNEMSFK